MANEMPKPKPAESKTYEEPWNGRVINTKYEPNLTASLENIMANEMPKPKPAESKTYEEPWNGRVTNLAKILQAYEVQQIIDGFITDELPAGIYLLTEDGFYLITENNEYITI